MNDVICINFQEGCSLKLQCIIISSLPDDSLAIGKVSLIWWLPFWKFSPIENRLHWRIKPHLKRILCWLVGGLNLGKPSLRRLFPISHQQTSWVSVPCIKSERKSSRQTNRSSHESDTFLRGKGESVVDDGKHWNLSKLIIPGIHIHVVSKSDELQSLPSHVQTVHREVTAGEHDHDRHQHLGRFPASSELSHGAGISHAV